MRYSLQIHPFEASAAQTARRKVVMAAPGAPAKVDLVAVLSNAETSALFQRLTKRDWRQVKRAAAKPRDRTRDGKRKFGTVSRTVLQVLAEAESSMRFIEIHTRTEALLGSQVSRSSVKMCLSAECKRQTPRFERVARGLYRPVTCPDDRAS